jgi:hypothetical protein
MIMRAVMGIVKAVEMIFEVIASSDLRCRRGGGGLFGK